MAESRRQHKLHCQTHYLPDRHVSQKMSQVYRWLVPESGPGSTARPAQLMSAQYEKNCRHLRSSLL